VSSRIASLLERNRAFAASDVREKAPSLPVLPHAGLFIVTCVDSRVDPAEFLGLRFGDAIVARTVGGRATPGVVQDLAIFSYLLEEWAPEGPAFEVAVIHHTECGSALLADESVRRDFAHRTGYAEDALAELPVLDPADSVRADVERIASDPRVSSRIAVSGHVYDVRTGLLTTIVEP